MSLNSVVSLVATWLVLVWSHGVSQVPPPFRGPPPPAWGPPAPSNWYCCGQPPPLPAYGNYGPYGGFCCFTININIPGTYLPGTNTTVPSGPLALLPNGSMILPGGSIRYPNATVVLTQYASGVIPPAGRLPSGRIIYANNTIIAAGVATSFPPPGVPLNATIESTAYPPLFLPNRTVIFHNGTLVPPGLGRILTVFTRGYIPNCGGLACHFFVPTG